MLCFFHFNLFPAFPPWFPTFPPLFPALHSDSHHFYPDSYHSHLDSPPSNSDSPHSHPDSPHSHPHSPHSHRSLYSVPRFSIPTFTDSPQIFGAFFYLKVKVLKMLKILIDCHIKTCRSPKWTAILKISSTVF